jgi:hypothetical protein
VPVTEKPHFDAPCPGIAWRLWPALTGSFRPRRWKGRAFILLKAGVAERESSKHAEFLVTGLPTILGIRHRHGREPVATNQKLPSEVVRMSISASYG